MYINVRLKYQRENTEERILVDWGAERLLINKQFYYNKGIRLEKY